MERTIVGFFDTQEQAYRAVEQIRTLGIPDANILTSSDSSGPSTTAGTGDSFGDRMSNFFSRMLGYGVDEQDAGIYAEGVRRGGHVVSVTADDMQAERVADILESAGAADVNRRSQYYQESGFDRFDAQRPIYNEDEILQDRNQYSSWEQSRMSSSPDLTERLSDTRRADTGEVIPVVQEEVTVGKRAFEKGRVRVYARVTETPVEQDITLKEEHVQVERRPVNRPVGLNDMNAFKEGEIVLKETAEEAQVEKVARVVEEVVVRKDTDQRTEHIHETARRTDVEVERTDSDRRALPEDEPRRTI